VGGAAVAVHAEAYRDNGEGAGPGAQPVLYGAHVAAEIGRHRRGRAAPEGPQQRVYQGVQHDIGHLHAGHVGLPVAGGLRDAVVDEAA